MSNNATFTIAAVIVTYHPDISLQQRLVSVVPQVQKVVIVDNTEDASSEAFMSALEDQGCHIIRNRSNAGIARALNQGIEWAVAQGCSWILTLDDDTRVYDGLVALYSDALSGQLKGCNVGILNTQYIDVNTRTIGSVVPGRKIAYDWIDVEVMISSGCFFSVETYRKAGGYREEFFLDWFDHDFCLRVRRVGLKNYMYRRPMLEHALGNKSTHTIPLIGIVITTNNHPPQRCYLIARNLTVLVRENCFREARLSIFYIMYLLLKFGLVFFFEQEKAAKLHALWLGLSDAICNKPISSQDITKNGIIRR